MRKILITGAAILALATPAWGRTRALSAGDRQFLNQAAQVDRSEVNTAQLALNRSTNPAVRQFAKRMIRDHSMNSQSLDRTAKGLGVALSTGGGAGPSNLSGLKGSKFDRTYLQDEISDHQKAISAFRNEIRTSTDPQVRDYAKRTLPILQSHLRMAQQAQSRLGGQAK